MSKRQIKYQLGDLKDKLDTIMENEISEKLAEMVKYITENRELKKDELSYALRILVDDVKNIVTDCIRVKSL